MLRALGYRLDRCAPLPESAIGYSGPYPFHENSDACADAGAVCRRARPRQNGITSAALPYPPRTPLKTLVEATLRARIKPDEPKSEEHARSGTCSRRRRRGRAGEGEPRRRRPKNQLRRNQLPLLRKLHLRLNSIESGCVGRD